MEVKSMHSTVIAATKKILFKKDDISNPALQDYMISLSLLKFQQKFRDLCQIILIMLKSIVIFFVNHVTGIFYCLNSYKLRRASDKYWY